MTALTHRRLSRNIVNRLIDEAPATPTQLTDDHRRSLSARFHAVSLTHHRRLDAWMLERAGRDYAPFRWSPTSARRVVGNAALRRMIADPSLSGFGAVEREITDHLVRAGASYARLGTLGSWLASCAPSVIGLVSAEASNWATQLREIAEDIEQPWSVAPSDAYYDVARARTTLRGRRDLVAARGLTRVIVRVRAGAPGTSAGPGLRADLTIDALAEPSGLAASRIIGLWPEAGVVLCVDGAMEDLRAGARDLVRAAVAGRRHQLPDAA